MATASTRPISRKGDDYFFSAMALLSLTIVYVGFARSYFLAGVFHAQLPSVLVHVHGAIFSCWILLFLAQIALVSAGRVGWHKQLGLLGVALAALMVILGFATLFAAVHRHFLPGTLTQTISAYDALQLVLFAVLVTRGFADRREGPAHKRLMMLATVSILGPALSRWRWSFIATRLAFFGVLDSFLILLIAYDLWSRRRVHRVTIWGSLAIVALQFAFIPLSHAAFWHRVTVWIQSL
jgi:hypothetical protein